MSLVCGRIRGDWKRDVVRVVVVVVVAAAAAERNGRMTADHPSCIRR